MCSASIQTLMFSLQLGYRIAPHKSCYLLQLICATNSLNVLNFLSVNGVVIEFLIYLVQFIIKSKYSLTYRLYVALGFFHPCPAFEAAKQSALYSAPKCKGDNFITRHFFWVTQWRSLFCCAEAPRIFMTQDVGLLGESVLGECSLTALPTCLFSSFSSLSVNYCVNTAGYCRIALWIWQEHSPFTRERQLMVFLEGQLLRNLLI